MNTVETTVSWRDVSGHFVEIGKALAEIQIGLRLLQATAAITDERAKYSLREMKTSARRLTTHLDKLVYLVGDYGPHEGE